MRGDALDRELERAGRKAREQEADSLGIVGFVGLIQAAAPFLYMAVAHRIGWTTFGVYVGLLILAGIAAEIHFRRWKRKRGL